MVSDLVIGVDVGTTSCKAVALSAAGDVQATGSGEYATHSPVIGAAEQEPRQLLAAVTGAVQQVVEQIGGERVAALSFSGAMHSVLPVDAAGAPLGRAVTWADARPGSMLAQLAATADTGALRRRTGCPLQAPYHPVRLRWLASADPARFAAAERFLAIKDWLILQLTGRCCTDRGLASTTGLLDLGEGDWDREALELAGVTADRLPPLVGSAEVVGRLTTSAAGACGLSADVPVVAGGADGPLANLGAGCGAPGRTVVTLGTSGAIRAVVDRPLPDDTGRTWCYGLLPGRWLVGGAINNAGLVLKWVRSTFYADESASDVYRVMLDEAAAIVPGAAGLMMLPYLTGERSPHWQPDAEGSLLGMSLRHGRAHVVRAALEATAFAMRDLWQAMPSAARRQPPLRLTGGVTRYPLWSQVVVDVLGEPMVPVERADASAIGAAMLGHLGLGRDLPSDRAEDVATVLQPGADVQVAYQSLYERYCQRQSLALQRRWK